MLGGNLKQKPIAIPFSKYHQIKKPDLSPLSKDWTPTEKHSLTVPDPLRLLEWRATRGKHALEATCASCGATSGVEMHHVRKLADLKGRDYIETLMITANRKQIPLCRKCHLQAHGQKQK